MQIQVKVHPGANRNQVIQLEENSFKVELSQAPEKGKANQALIKLLAKHFALKKNQISILRGQQQKNKIVSIEETS